MRVRSAELDDVSCMMALEREAQTAAHWTEENYTSIFTERSPKRMALVAEIESLAASTGVRSFDSFGVAGFIVARVIDAEWEIENVVVSLTERRRGIGSLLVNELLKRARLEGARLMELEVRSTNTGALALYGSCGFVQWGTRKGYYSNPLEDALLLRLDFPAAASENG